MKTFKILFAIFLATTGWGEDLPFSKQTPPDFMQELSLSDNSSVDLATTTYETAFIRMLFVLIGLLLFTCLGVYLFKRFSTNRLQQSNHARNIKILEKRAISPKSMLYLVEVGGKKLLLGESQLELRHLSGLEWIESEKKGL